MRHRFSLLFVISLSCLSSLVAADLSHQTFEGSVETASVTVKRGGLVHTELLTAKPDQNLTASFNDLASQIETIAGEFDTSLTHVAKLNLYLDSKSPDQLDELHNLVQSKWESGKAPALTLIPSKLPDGRLLAGDAVIAADVKDGGTKKSTANAAMMPAHRDIIYVSGRAASGELAPATAGTMTQLFEVLEHLESKPEDVVQVKAFLQPIEQWKTVDTEIKKSFGGKAPPIVFAEWISSSRATEIELIAAAPDHRSDKGTISYFTPPGDKKSPVYSRGARIHSDRVIYLSGHGSEGNETATGELLAELKKSAEGAGTDERHFAKATYYVTTPEASASLNTLRPDYYDPERPPAASKVMIRSLGSPEVESLIDMVAAPAEK